MAYQTSAPRTLPREEILPAWRTAVLAYRANIRADGDRVARTKAVAAFREVLPQMPKAEAEWETTQAIAYAASQHTAWFWAEVANHLRIALPASSAPSMIEPSPLLAPWLSVEELRAFRPWNK
jgi:hypothetical protein